MGTTTVTLPSASVALGFNTAATTNANVRTTEGVVSATGTASHSETATTTGAAVSATKTGGASEVFGHRNSGLIVGAAMFGISFLSSALVSAF
ncbi:hypothetical protein N7466_003206 [Penicillium verhagenii]|uniref:uncharacterized protein n=1 Tax=Penicillium verhagenii TaxID=1562060 RepID=UPI0025452C5F|nr:uncharacterized protein N7466_003206 [Penicillium verhagenii]KAJ5936756.1 hypothetical protein N7466_003206 [Penicillium verhagenii]